MIKKNNIIAILTEPYKFELIVKNMPFVQDDYVLVEYLYCGICGGDYSAYCGYRQTYPISLGHEFIAKVISVGDSVKTIMQGQYVVSDFNYRCGSCAYCDSKQSHLCTKNDIGLFSNRGFSKYATIHSSYLAVIEPPNYLPRACLIEPLSCVIHACQTMNIKSGTHILLCGGGGIGMLFCFLLSRVFQNIEITIAEINQQKMEFLCKHFGVKSYCPQNNKHDLIIDCSNSISGLKFSLNNAYQGERICIMSHLYGLETSFVYEQACKKELRCYFPLRNGEKTNLFTATHYIKNFWTSEDDVMLCIYDNIETAFKEKSSNSFCKQIIQTTTLCVP